MGRPRGKLSKTMQKRVSKKIGKLRREGKTAAQAAGAAYGMARAGRLTKGGGYKRVKKRKAK